MKLQGIKDILASAAMPQILQSPVPMVNMPQEELPPGFFEPEKDIEAQEQDSDFQDNLAEDMSESYLDQLASEFNQEIDDDETDRKPWMDMISNVQEMIGIGDDSSYDEPFPGCSSVVFPLFVKAQIQFTSRAMPEIFPNDPVKGLVLGSETPELKMQSDRVAATMNFQYQYQDPENKEDFAKMLTWLPYTGSAFRYVSHDPLRNINTVRYVPGGDLIVPYASTSLKSVYRFTYRFTDSKNDIIKLQRLGFYRDVDIFNGSTSFSGETNESNNAVKTLRDASDGMVPDSDNSNNQQNQECYNIYTYRDLEGYEDKDKKGEMTGIALPYVFTMHKESGKILAIRRNWKEDDEYKSHRVYFSHYQYHKGLGFYGFGLPHLLGSIQTALTGALRSFGDSMAFSMLQGGWKLKGAKVSGSQVMKPGDYLDIDAEIDDIKKAVMPISYNPPPPIVIEYIQLLTKVAEEIISIGDLMTGDSSPQNAPVGSTVAMIEQATKVVSAQHKSLYESLSNEFQIMYDLNYDYLPTEDQFVVPKQAGIIRRSDFDGKVGVRPTADPSVASFQMRQAIDQATMQILSIPEFKPFVKESGYALMMRMLNNLNVPDLEQIVMTDKEAEQFSQQQQQNPPPPTPDQIKAQVMQQDSQTKAQTAQSDAQLQQQKMQFDQQMEGANKQIEMLKLQLQDKAINMKFATDDKMIDARFLGQVAPALQQSSDGLAMQNIQHEQAKELQAQDQQHQMNMQRMGAVAQAATQPQQQGGEAPPQAPNPQDVHDHMMQAQQAGQQQQPSDKQGMLMSLMNKIRGR